MGAGLDAFDLEGVRAAAARAIAPLAAAGPNAHAPENLLLAAKRTDAGRNLPPNYLVYFLLIDLLGFRNLGQFEKVAWSVPVQLNDKVFLVEHRKLGLGIFAANLPEDEADAAEVARLVHRASKAAAPYYAWKAEEAAKASALNVINRSRELFGRFEFFAGLYASKTAEAEERKAERIETEVGPNAWSVTYPSYQLRRDAAHYAISTIESFFSWTEHVFILIAILRGVCVTGEAVRDLARADWEAKFKGVFDVADGANKGFYDGLLHLRRQVRNFVAHGSFGKDGEAFQFHSPAGAVPMRMTDGNRGRRFKFGAGEGFVDREAIEFLHRFIDHLWSGEREPARIYIQDYDLPLILTRVKDGTYSRAMASVEEMTAFSDYLAREMDRSANMDF